MKNYKEDFLFDNYEIIKRVINKKAVIKIGDLEVTSGKIIIGDFGSGISIDHELAATFPIGKFPVYHSRIYEASVLIAFTDEEPVAWKAASYNLQKKVYLKAFVVETGNFCFTDSDGLNAIINNVNSNLYVESFWEDEIYSRCIQKNYKGYFNIPIANSQNNIIATDTESEEGIYKSYIGYNPTGNIVCLFTELGPVMF